MESITLPGGIVIPFSGLDSFEGYHRVMNALGAAMGPFKIVLDFLDLFIELQTTLETVPGVITSLDPASFVSSLQEVIRKVSRLRQYIPQLSIPTMVNGVLKTIIPLLDTIEAQLDILAGLEENRIEVLSLLSLDSSLTATLEVLDEQEEAQSQVLSDMLSPLTSLLDLVNTFLSVVGSPFSFPVISGGTVEEVRSSIDIFKEFLETITY